MAAESLWNSLEVAKLAVSVLTPLSIVLLGFLFNKRLLKLESGQEDTRRRQDTAERQARDELERRYAPEQ